MRVSLASLAVIAAIAVVAFAQDTDPDYVPGGGDWEQVTLTGAIEPRLDHQASMIGDYLYVFAGKSGTTYYDRIWRANLNGGNGWDQLNPAQDADTQTTPAARADHSWCLYITQGGQDIKGDFYVYGGVLPNGTALNDFWEWDSNQIGEQGEWIYYAPDVTYPPAQDHASCVEWNDYLFWIGGEAEGVSLGGDDLLWRFQRDNGAWTQMNGAATKPAARQDHSTVVIDNKIVMFGGTIAGTPTDEVWVYDLDEDTWTEIEKPTGADWPSARYDHIAAFEQGYLLIHGGYDGTTVLNDVWRLNIYAEQPYWVDETPTAGTNPAYHRHGGGTYRKKLVFMGGSTTPTGEVGTVDVWQLNLPDFPPTRENDFEGAASSLIASVAAIAAALALAVLAA